MTLSLSHGHPASPCKDIKVKLLVDISGWKSIISAGIYEARIDQNEEVWIEPPGDCRYALLPSEYEIIQ